MSKYKPSLKKRISLNVFKKYIDIQSQLHELSYLFWECTLKCNINCLHCGSDCTSDNQIKDMPADDFLNITNEINTHTNPNKVMVVLTGGEPLLRNDLEYIGRNLYNQGYPWGMVSNGLLLNQEKFNALLDSGLRSITLSFDGLKENHNWLRGSNKAFNKVIDAINIITKVPDLTYDVVTCVNKRNFIELENIKSLLIDLGVKKWRLFTITPIGRAKQFDELNISEKDFLELFEFIKATRKEGKIKASYGCEGFLGSFENEVRDGYFFCRAGINIASVLADGTISACPNINRKIFGQGNIYKDNFLQVWNTKFDVMRNRSWAKTGICSDCEVFKWCRGNGLHLRCGDNNEVVRCHYNAINLNN